MSAGSEDYPVPEKLAFPVSPYEVTGYRFGKRVRSRLVLWARHLGEDVLAGAGTGVRACGPGRVVWSEMRLGTKEQPNWGGLVVIGHTHTATQQPFYSLYGHLKNLRVKRGDQVVYGQIIGSIADSNTPENGRWKLAHLHFAIYLGPWMDHVLPGYLRLFDGRTRFHWWRRPSQFVREYNSIVARSR
jgi:murein DD-endopeptidase MepM/ murein hydrolase activator NlpD